MSAYESLLRSLTYNNLALEPTPGNRYINITLFDGRHRDITAVIIIVVLVNDNPLMIEADTQRLTFTEGDVVLAVGVESGLRLLDGDRDATVAYLRVSLEGSLEPTREFVVLDVGPLGGEMEQGLEVIVNQTGLLTDYQVRQVALLH